MLRYLYTLEYDDEKEAASIAPYLLTTSSSETAEFDGQLAESEAKLLARLLNNIAVYTVAKKYEIPELKVLAQEKVKALIWKHSLSPDFPIVINAIFHSTPSSDGGLREIAVEFCKHKELAIVKDERLCSMLRSHGDLGAAMVIGLLCDHAEYKRSSDDRKRSNQDRMAGLKRRLKDMECNAKDALTELDSTTISNNFHVQDARISVVTLQANLTKAKEMATLH